MRRTVNRHDCFNTVQVRGTCSNALRRSGQVQLEVQMSRSTNDSAGASYWTGSRTLGSVGYKGSTFAQPCLDLRARVSQGGQLQACGQGQRKHSAHGVIALQWPARSPQSVPKARQRNWQQQAPVAPTRARTQRAPDKQTLQER
jgi:hypothetical protein